MKTGDIIEITSNVWKCKYMITEVFPYGYVLQRIIKAKTKADNNRFADILYININHSY